MKIEHIAKTNEKGQIVIPKQLRDELGINEKVPLHLIKKGTGIYVYPIKEVIGLFDDNDSYVSILKKTAGAWGPGSKEEKLRNKARHELESKASKRRKQQW